MKKHLAVYYLLAGDTSQVSVFSCLLCLCGNREYPGSFQNKAVSSSFKRVPSEVTGKTFLKWSSIDLSSKLPLTYGVNVNHYKSVHHPVPTLPVGTGNTVTIFKTNQ